MKKLVPFLSLFLINSYFSLGQDGTLDNSFGTGGKARMVVPGLVGSDSWNALQADGKIVTASTGTNGTNKVFMVARFKSNGTTDSTFGTNGRVTTDFLPGLQSNVRGIAIQTDGKIVVSGYGAILGNNNDVLIARYNTDGSLDNTFDSDGKVQTDIGRDDFGYCVTIQSDGKIIVAGGTNMPVDYNPVIFRYNTDGTLDNTFNGNGYLIFPGLANDEYALAVTMQSDDKIVVSGYLNGTPWAQGEIMRINPNGTPDITFGTNGLVNMSAIFPWYSILYGVTVLSSGKIAVTGASTTAAGSTDLFVSRLLANGSLDNSFNGFGYNDVHVGYSAYAIGIKEQSNGKLIISGGARNVVTEYDFVLARVLTNGSFDNTFDGDGVLSVPFSAGADNEYGINCLIQPNGMLVLAGGLQNGAEYDFGVIRVQSDIAVLPVTMQSFEAVKKPGQSVLLAWTTATEQNNRGFDIQRSYDGVHFNTIGWLNGAGNSSALQHYSFTDITAAKGNNFYRIMQVDADGRGQFSETRKIYFESTNSFTVFPNPVKTDAHIMLTNDVQSIRLTATDGKLLWQKGRVQAGTVNIPMQQLSAGLYVLQIVSKDGEKSVQKIVKQ